MITETQRRWLNHLSNTDRVSILPFDPGTEELFEKVKQKVVSRMGNNFEILHRGASHLKILGQNEIDIYIPVIPKLFNSTVLLMEENFGKPRSLYPLIRARFRLDGYNKNVDVFIVNREDAGWVNSEIFTEYLLSHSKALLKFQKLKESWNGLSTREYYTKKFEFIDEILAKAAIS